MQHIPIEALTEYSTRIFAAAGAPMDIAARVAGALVQSDVYGVHSHGTNLLPAYIAAIGDGRIVPSALPTVVRENPVTGLVDGQKGFGHVTGEFATRLAMQKAMSEGVGIVCAVNTNHIGRIGEYVEMAAQAGQIGVCVVNAGAQVTPFGGLAKRFGTNPLAFSVPVPGGRPLLVDFATSAAAANKILVAQHKGVKIPDGWILDGDGRPSNNPADLFNGGYLLTFGQYKGYGLSIMVEVLAGLLSGSGSAVYEGFHSGNGVFVMALSPEFFRPSEEFLADVKRLVAELRSIPPLDGVEKVMVPGDPEEATEAHYRREGIALDDESWRLLVEAGRSVGVEPLAAKDKHALHRN
jgi:LDH2 family malate/lactate/ureidoglycolate dehydrogenase